MLADRDRDALEVVAAELHAPAVCMDVTSADDYERLAQAAGPVDLVCLNAGISSVHGGPVWEYACSPVAAGHGRQPRRVSSMDCARSCPACSLRNNPVDVLVTASLAGLLTWPGGGAYAASKHVAVAVAEQAALALAGTAVSVTVLCPALGAHADVRGIGDDPAGRRDRGTRRRRSAAGSSCCRRKWVTRPVEERREPARRG